MLHGQTIRHRRLAEKRIHHLFGLVDGRGQVVDGILCVQVKIDPVVSQRVHVRITSRGIAALGVRGPHVGRILANHVGDGPFILDHLRDAHVGRDHIQAVVRPGVGGYLVPLIDHAPEQVRPGGGGIDFTFPEVVPRDEKGRGEAILLQQIQQCRRVEIRTVVVRQGHHVRLRAAVDIVVIRDLA